ncbi:Uncharacterised protein [BD1-7 clade bacterium]|uniref:Porin domain-containing protein n=1 Tax=BD1-7 clade bacterium TaxID=2029982 RepID=A0A5S9QZI1_9GAMM|nr:Uncharacterised protein [BD1-7 clade bacterium]
MTLTKTIKIGSLAALALISTTAVAHKAEELNTRIDASASFSYRTNGAVDKTDYWRIPGLMMGGEATPVPKGVSLDDAQLRGTWKADDNNYVFAKISAHGDGSHNELELEHLWYMFQLKPEHVGMRLELGQMAGIFTPSANWHASTDTFSEAPLIADAFFGRYFIDKGARISTQFDNFDIGLSLWNGDSFPASSGDGSGDIFINYQANFDGWQVSAGVWGMVAQADLRGDERYSDGHSHSNINPPPTDIRFSGTSYLGGLHAGLQIPLADSLAMDFRGEWLTETSDGEILDSNRRADLKGDYAGYLFEAALIVDRHRISFRQEGLILDNTISGPSAQILAEEANLINNGKDPERFTVSWRWQIIDQFTLRTEWVNDSTVEDNRQRFVIGGVWQQNLFSLK